MIGSIALETANLLQPGAVGGAMERVRDPGFLEELKRVFDTNADGALALEELLDVETALAAIRQLAAVTEVDPVNVTALEALEIPPIPWVILRFASVS